MSEFFDTRGLIGLIGFHAITRMKRLRKKIHENDISFFARS